MVLDFGALPPEVNSARMYIGAGAGPLLDAAEAWDQLSDDLTTAAAAYRSVVSGLTTGRWLGPSSLAMASAFGPYVAWTFGAAARAQETASQARDAAEIYEAAFTMTVPPTAVAANRVQLATLVATNLLGQNTAAIAANEAEYGEMWAQDAAAMYQYAANSAEAALLTVFAAAPEVTDPAGLLGQSNAVSNATSASATDPFSLAGLLSSVPSLLQGLAAPVSGSGAASILTPWGTLLNATGSSDLLSSLTSGNVDDLLSLLPTVMAVSTTPLFGLSSVLSIAQTLQGLATATVAGAADVAGNAAAAAADVGADALGGVGGVAGTMGEAATLGSLSVPQAWASVIPSAHLTSAGAALTNGGVGDVSRMPPSLLGGLPRGAGSAGPSAAPRYGVVPTVMAQPPSAGYGAVI